MSQGCLQNGPYGLMMFSQAWDWVETVQNFVLFWSGADLGISRGVGGGGGA